MSLLLLLLRITFISEQNKLAEDVLLHKQHVAHLTYEWKH